ncbi:hypothetical protein Z969_07895 [Clostridium novyi A str. 4570]|uniref:Uncharacterized protein n=1 Tax=Clostridium novyi A str. 4570 TaxID=1444290 RepID=A0AA89CRD6_CLONO|nr:hypothetical protein [Clostridium novyi]KGN01746.1 hypothetical protein Z969_07895 [Clostridium novyi A str. 4570]
MIDKFFNIACEAIKNEEEELNNLFNLNEEYYKTNHHGVCNLYETTFVYVIFKELLKQQYPYTVYWEYPYPSNSKLHCDIGLLNKYGELDSLIEFKIWIKNDDKDIKKDILKLQSEKGCKKYIFIIGYGGDIIENDKYLCRDEAPLKIVNKKQLKTKFFKVSSKKIEDNELNLFMYEIIQK